MCSTKRLDLSIFCAFTVGIHGVRWSGLAFSFFWWFHCKAPQSYRRMGYLVSFLVLFCIVSFAFLPSSLLFSIFFNLLQNFSTFWYTLCQSVSLWFSSPGVIAPIANNTPLCFTYNNNSNEWKFSKCYHAPYRLQYFFSPDQDSGLGITPPGKGA